MTADSGTPIVKSAAIRGITPHEQNGDKPPANAARKIISTGDPDYVRDLWLSLRELVPDVAGHFRLDTIVAERLEKMVSALQAKVVTLTEKLDLQKSRQDSAFVVALQAGTVREIAIHEGQHVERGALALHVETDAQLVTVSIASSETQELQQLLPIDAPVDMTIHRDRFSKLTDQVIETARSFVASVR